MRLFTEEQQSLEKVTASIVTSHFTYLSTGVGSEVLSRRMCMSLSTRPLPVARIRTYTINEGPMRAVIFITKRGIKVCADPKALWVKKAMKDVDRTRSLPMTQMSSSGTQNPTSIARTLNA
ncbi:cytokine SCM-1 beta-like [Suncus etruscus]|uniref:cytokine SCM-1 beta-like n=1 Tax=Suncus etruscus TaxID=109475 RepID=UPI00210F280E|nr:cytokine SCM-1 beta-like [Suncus etruscus]